jgi:hypothetical protein
MTTDAKEYHKRPVMSVRIHRESLDWARGEADRRGQPFGDFIDGLIVAERVQVHGCATSPVAAGDEQPQTREGQ